MGAYDIIIRIMAAFAVLGALDRIFGNRFGLGKPFEEGILAAGSLALAMIGVICLAPVLAQVLRPVIVPVFSLLGADPAMFAGTILACDMGGGSLAMELAGSEESGLMGGILAGSMMGATIVFTIPVALGILQPQDRPALAKGVLCGIITIPFGIFCGSLAAGFPLGMVLRNLVPIVLIAGLIVLGLWKAEKAMILGFTWFGKGITALITLGLAAAIIQALTNITLIPGMTPISEGWEIVGEIAIVLAGAFPLVHAVTHILHKPLMKIGHLLRINDASAAGLVATLANSIASFGMVSDMDARGKIVNIAFAVSAAFVFGDHLGFTAGFAPRMLVPMIIGKLAGGVSAVAVALWLTRKYKD